jgi:hypothetical protein
MNYKIQSGSDAIKSIQNTNFERGQLIFHGHVNEQWELIPSLFRPNIEDPSSLEAASFESLLLGDIHPYSISYDPIEHLTHLQHFKFPTRLLDWTSDLFVALFFACHDERNEHADKDGNLLIIQRNLYPELRVNCDENKKFEMPFTSESVINLKERIDIDDMWIFEPVIKNPRMRIQDGCFMFFPFLPIDAANPKLCNLNEYNAARNKYIRKKNKEEGTNEQELWIGNKLIDKNYKTKILEELDYKYGISQETIYVENSYVREVQDYYSNLQKNAILKAGWIKMNRKNKG